MQLCIDVNQYLLAEKRERIGKNVEHGCFARKWFPHHHESVPHNHHFIRLNDLLVEKFSRLDVPLSANNVNLEKEKKK